MKKLTLLIMTILMFASCSNDNTEQNQEKSFSELIIGKWKLTKQEEVIDGVTFTTDYTDENDETTHTYFENGSMIFYEWGETFNLRHEISGDILYHIGNGNDVSDYRIISMDNSEMILDLLDSDGRIRYYDKVQ